MGFVTRHKERDEKLFEDMQKIRIAIKNDLSNDKEVLAIFYGGSTVRGNNDLYSDLDLRVVVTEEAYSKYIANKKERARNWGEVLYFEDRGQNVPYSIAHFKNFINGLMKFWIWFFDTFYKGGGMNYGILY